jgi:formylglycine-generating enzyme required for sulfatase activity
MKMIRIEPGTFTMGSNRGDFDEKPIRQVTIGRFDRIWKECAQPGPGRQ